MPRHNIASHGAGEANGVNAVMRAKAVVFNRNHRIGHIIGQLANFRSVTKECPFLGQHCAVTGEHHNAGLALGNLKQAALIETEPNIGKAYDPGHERPETKGYRKLEQPPFPTTAWWLWPTRSRPSDR